MDQELPPNEAALYRRCDEVLHYVWDPIGVSGRVATRDEYDDYVPPIFALVNENASSSEIADALVRFVSERMELTPDRQKAQYVAELLLGWRERINDDAARKLVSGR